MAEMSELKATARPRSGKGAARAVRREGRVPAVIYGDGKEPETVSLETQELNMLLGKGKFLSTVINVDVGGKQNRVIPRDVQLDPVRDFPVHVDFQRIGATSRIRVNVPVVFTNEALSPGLKRGGVLNIVRHEIEVTCPADKIPTVFEFSLEGLEIGRSIHISAIKLPEGVKTSIQGRDFTVATVAGAKAEEETKPAEEAVAATTEGEGAAPAAAAAGDAKAAAGGAKPAAGGAKPAAGAAKAAPAAKAGGGKK